MIGLCRVGPTPQAQAAEIKVLSSTAMKTALEELGPQFEKATGNTVAFTIGPGRGFEKAN